MLNSNSTYSEVYKHRLDHRFGNTVDVAEEHKSRLYATGPVSVSIPLYFKHLQTIWVAAKGLQRPYERKEDSTQTLQKISAKPTSYSVVKWCYHARDERSLSISFSEFVKFVKNEADLINDRISHWRNDFNIIKPIVNITLDTWIQLFWTSTPKEDKVTENSNTSQRHIPHLGVYPLIYHQLYHQFIRCKIVEGHAKKQATKKRYHFITLGVQHSVHLFIHA